MKKLFVFLAVSLYLLVALPYTNAAITISKPAGIYNLGDNLTMRVNISEPDSLNGFVILNLDCDDYKKEIYKVPLSIEAEEEKLLEMPSLFLSKRMVGLCYVKAAFEDIDGNKISEASTEHFTISNLINLTAIFNKKVFLPEEKLKIEGKAMKLNGEEVDGSAVVTLDNKSYSCDVKNSFFEIEIDIAKDIKSGEHNVEVTVSDSLGNRGSAFGIISITPVPTALELVLNKNIFLPEENLTIKAILYDQAHGEISRDVILLLLSPQGKEKLGVKVLAGESVGYVFEKYASPGEWQIEVTSAGLEAKETIVMQEYKAIDIILDDSMLHIINIGNVPYAEAIEIEFKQGNIVTLKNKTISLDIGEETFIKLSAPDGNYNISIESSVAKKTFTDIPLTGSVVAVKKLSEIRRANFIKYSSITLLLLIVLILILKKFLPNLREKRRKEALKSEEEAVYQYIKKLKNETG